MSIPLFHESYSQSSSERLRRPLENIQGRSAPGIVHSSSFFTIYIDNLAEFEKDTFVSTYADDQLIARNASNKDMIIASLHVEVDEVVVWSDKARLSLNTSK